MPEIKVTVRNRIATIEQNKYIVCGNSDYTIKFEFDSEWDSYATKTARFVINNNFVDMVFTGTECSVPIISNSFFVNVGVYSGDLQTTSSAIIPCRKSILCGTGTNPEPDGDAYSQLIALLNDHYDIITAKNDAILAKEGSVNAKDISVEAKNDSISAKNDSEAARDIGIGAKNDAIRAKNDAITAKDNAITAKNAAVLAQAEAKAAAEEAHGLVDPAYSASTDGEKLIITTPVSYYAWVRAGESTIYISHLINGTNEKITIGG